MMKITGNNLTLVVDGALGHFPEEFVKRAIEKQLPKKPIRANRIIKKNGEFFLNDDNEYWKCPICTKFDVPLLENQPSCHWCGQALDWSES